MYQQNRDQIFDEQNISDFSQRAQNNNNYYQQQHHLQDNNINNSRNIIQQQSSSLNQDVDEFTIPEEIISPTLDMIQQQRTFDGREKFMKVCDRVKRYDGLINNKRGLDQCAQNNPLIRNKGYIADDWLWEKTLKQEQRSKQQLLMVHHHHSRVKSFQTNTQLLGSADNSVDNNNKLFGNIGASSQADGKQTLQFGLQTKQIIFNQKDSAKNISQSFFNLNQSTNPVSNISNNIHISRLGAIPSSNIKDSNNRLTFKTLNDQMWDTVSRQDNNNQTNQSQQQFLLPQYQQYSQNLGGASNLGIRSSIVSNDQSPARIQPQLNRQKFKFSGKQFNVVRQSYEQEEQKSKLSPPESLQNTQSYRGGSMAGERIQPRNKLSNFIRNNQGSKVTINKSTQQSLDLPTNTYNPNSNQLIGNLGQGSNVSMSKEEQLAARYHQQTQQIQNQMFCDNLMIEEIQENSEECMSSLKDEEEGEQESIEEDSSQQKYLDINIKNEESESQFKKSQTAYLSQRRNESLYLAQIKRKKYNRTKSQVVYTVKSQEIQLNELSKSYVYLVKGLSEEIENIESLSQGVCQLGLGSKIGTFGLINYNSIFFENDMNLEQYKQGIKDALSVQFQKEKNISHQIIKSEYDKWVHNFQIKFQKTSPHKKTIVFDLDETLVRAQEVEFQNGSDSKIRVIDSEKEDFMIYVKWRPGLEEALIKLKENFELILFTAASEQYAKIVLQTFEGHQYFDHILSRNHCLFIEQYKVYVKDLQILTQGRQLQDVIIVDNKIESYSSHLENGIPIKSYYGEEDDDRLPHLVKHLMKLKDVKDVRPHILKDFLLQEITDNKISNHDNIIDSDRIMECMQKDRDRYKSMKDNSKQARNINNKEQPKDNSKKKKQSRRDQYPYAKIGVGQL